MIDTDDRHLEFGYRPHGMRLVHVTTLATLKGIRGRVYFAPTRLLHDAMARSMMTAAARHLGAQVQVVAQPAARGMSVS